MRRRARTNSRRQRPSNHNFEIKLPAMKLLIFPAVDSRRYELICKVAGDMNVVNAANEATAMREIVDADAFFGKITPALLRTATKLRWVQSPTASLEHYMFEELVNHPCVLGNMRGLYSDVIADHVMGYVLCFARNLHIYIRQQIQTRYEPIGGEEARSNFVMGVSEVSEID